MTANKQVFVKTFARRNRRPEGIDSVRFERHENSLDQGYGESSTRNHTNSGQELRVDHEAHPSPRPYFSDDIRVSNLRDQIAAESEDAIDSKITNRLSPSQMEAPKPLSREAFQSLQHQIDILANHASNHASTHPSIEQVHPGTFHSPASLSHNDSLLELSRIEAKGSRRLDHAHFQSDFLRMPVSVENSEVATDSSANLFSSGVTTNQKPKSTERYHRTASVESKSNPTASTLRSHFRAAWEVDQFDVPSNVAKLFFDSKLFQTVAEQMLHAVQTGLDSVLITSAHSKEGRSTVAIGVSIAAAAAGIRVALIDADLTSPTLVDELSLDVERGWVDALYESGNLSEIAVHAIEDRVTFFPLFRSERATSGDVEAMIEKIKQYFDLVVIDGPIGDSRIAMAIASKVKSAMVVRDIHNTTNEEIHVLSCRLLEAGIQGIGVVDNFV